MTALPPVHVVVHGGPVPATASALCGVPVLHPPLPMPAFDKLEREERLCPACAEAFRALPKRGRYEDGDRRVYACVAAPDALPPAPEAPRPSLHEQPPAPRTGLPVVDRRRRPRREWAAADLTL